MSKEHIITAICSIKMQAEEIEDKIEKLSEKTVGCANCGYLTQEALDHNQEMSLYISELQSLAEALDYLQEMTK